MTSISGIVISCNEERNIVRCLQSLKFCDEIILVDSGSTDRTRALAAIHTPKIVVRPWQGYANQKNYALSLASSEWVISVDADEEVSSELASEIIALLKHSTPYSAFLVPRKTLHSGVWIRHGGWYPNRLIRLFKRREGCWEGDDVHESWKTDKAVGILNEHLIHYSFQSIRDQVDRNNLYSTLGANALKRAGARFSCLKLIGKPLLKFLETFVAKRGFLDGFPGFFISVSAAYSVFLKWAKYWEITRHAPTPQE